MDIPVIISSGQIWLKVFSFLAKFDWVFQSFSPVNSQLWLNFWLKKEWMISGPAVCPYLIHYLLLFILYTLTIVSLKSSYIWFIFLLLSILYTQIIVSRKPSYTWFIFVVIYTLHTDNCELNTKLCFYSHSIFWSDFWEW